MNYVSQSVLMKGNVFLWQPTLCIKLVPFSLLGVGWGHLFHGFPINILSFLGVIALIGGIVYGELVLISKFIIYLKDDMRFDDAILGGVPNGFVCELAQVKNVQTAQTKFDRSVDQYQLGQISNIVFRQA